MNLRDLWLAKAVVDLGLYAAHGIQKLVRGSPKPEPEPELDDQSQPLSHADVDYIEATIDSGARAFPAPTPKPQPHHCNCIEPSHNAFDPEAHARPAEPSPNLDPIERLKG